MIYEVIAIDWEEPNVIGTFTDPDAADRFAEAMDSSALRCYVRPAGTPEPTEHKPTEKETIAEFFTEFDRRVAADPTVRFAALRPVLEQAAAGDPRGFVKTIAEFFAEVIAEPEPRPKLAESVIYDTPGAWDGYCALETVKAQDRCRRQCESCKIAEERRRRG